MNHDTRSQPATSVPADDILSLKRHLPGGRFHYKDIASAQARHSALQRWPLLNELKDIHADKTRSEADLHERQTG